MYERSTALHGCGHAAIHVLHYLPTGGHGTRQEVANATILDFIRASATACPGKAAPTVLTVCTGAALAASSGILKGRRATTNKAAWAWATAQGEPGTIAWQKKARWVQDGNIWTSAGVTAGERAVYWLCTCRTMCADVMRGQDVWD